MAGDLGVRARVRACWSTTGAGKVELTRGSHCAARGNGRARKRFGVLTKRAREAERERASARARETALTGLAHRAAGGREGRESAGETG
jgi:hypothetical protein